MIAWVSHLGIPCRNCYSHMVISWSHEEEEGEKKGRKLVTKFIILTLLMEAIVCAQPSGFKSRVIISFIRIIDFI